MLIVECIRREALTKGYILMMCICKCMYVSVMLRIVAISRLQSYESRLHLHVHA